jgi:hypothetical protein
MNGLQALKFARPVGIAKAYKKSTTTIMSAVIAAANSHSGQGFKFASLDALAPCSKPGPGCFIWELGAPERAATVMNHRRAQVSTITYCELKPCPRKIQAHAVL